MTHTPDLTIAPKFVLVGLVILWASGFLFIGYYYLYTPEYLANQKVWGKLFIVVALTLNGFFVHQVIMPKVKRSIGKPLAKSLSGSEVKTVIIIGAISFFSWLFPIVLGVTQTLNFSVSAVDIIFFYIAVMTFVLAFASFLAKLFFKII